MWVLSRRRWNRVPRHVLCWYEGLVWLRVQLFGVLHSGVIHYFFILLPGSFHQISKFRQTGRSWGMALFSECSRFFGLPSLWIIGLSYYHQDPCSKWLSTFFFFLQGTAVDCATIMNKNSKKWRIFPAMEFYARSILTLTHLDEHVPFYRRINGLRSAE